MASDDVADLFREDPSSYLPMTFRQGVLESWDPATGENTVQIAGGRVINASSLTSEAANLAVGDVVSMLVAEDKWLLVGKVTTPGDPGTVPTWTTDITALQTDVVTAQTTATTAQTTANTAQTTADTAQTTADAAQADATLALGTASTAAADAAAAAADAIAAAGDAATALAKFPVTEVDIAEGAITAPKIAANAIDGIVITGALIRTAAAGRRVEQTVAGFVVYDASDVPLVLFPTDGQDPYFAGNVRAKQFTAENGATLGGTSELQPGSVLQLKSGVSAPKTPLVVTIDWPSIPWQNSYGLHWDGTNWLTINDTATPTLSTYSATGASVADISLPGFASNHLRPWGGVTKIGSEYYTLSYVADGTGEYRIHKLNSSGVATLSVVYTPIAGASGSGGDPSKGLAPAAIGTDGANVLVAEWDSANARYRIQTRSTSTLAVTATLNTNFSAGGPVMGVARGNFDFGADRFMIATRTNGLRTYNSSGLLQANEAVPAPATELLGAGWNGTNFWSSARNGGNPRAFKHTAQQYNAAGLYAVGTWYKSGSGYETTMGPAVSFTPPSRSRVTLTTVAIPGQADSVRFYIGLTATRTDQWRQVTPAVGVISQSYETILATGSNPPSSNSFPNTAPQSEVRFDDGSIAVGGDGSIRAVTTMKVGAADVLVGPAVVTGWTNLPLVNSWAVKDSLSAQYTKDAMGRVQLRGRISAGTAAATIATLPAGFRPTQEMEWTMRSVGGVVVCAIRIAASGVITASANAATVSSAGVNLDSISFPTH